MTIDPYTAWADGQLTPRQALTELGARLKIVQAQRESIEAEEKALRLQCEQVLLASGEDVIAAAGLEFRFTKASQTTSYAASDVEAFRLWLVDHGYAPLAEQLGTHRRESARAGGLRVTRERGKS